MNFDADALSRCVSCGLCLSACPTFQVTRAEQHGPRGRIAGMRMVERGEVPADEPAYLESMETCVQCRACEPACPSGVRFGELMEQALAARYERATTATDTNHGRALHRRVVDVVLAMIASPIALRAATLVLAAAQAMRLDRLLPLRWRVARRIRVRDMVRPLRPLRETAGARPALLFRGCIMDAWFRPVHAATLRVLGAAGYAVRVTPGALCCGALHLHAGRRAQAVKHAQRIVAAYAGTRGDIVVNSAGCAAALREYDRLLGTPEAKVFAARIRDFAEAATAGDPQFRPLGMRVTYQAACHLKNVLRSDAHAERLLRRIPGLAVARPADGELCCGAGGAYSVFQPAFAARMRERKKQALAETGGDITVSGNPGCILHLAGAGVPIVHIAELVARALPTDDSTSEMPAAGNRTT